MKGPAPVHSASAICGSVAAADAAAHSGIAAAFFTPSDVGDFEPLTVKAFVKKLTMPSEFRVAKGRFKAVIGS